MSRLKSPDGTVFDTHYLKPTSWWPCHCCNCAKIIGWYDERHTDGEAISCTDCIAKIANKIEKEAKDEAVR